MKRTKLVIVFSDEESDKNIDLLLKDLEETGLTEPIIVKDGIENVFRFDNCNKMVVEVDSEVPDPDYKGTLEEYWFDVINESKCPCCYPIEQTSIAVYSVTKLADFRKNDIEFNRQARKVDPNSNGNYSFLDELL